jgi:branched-chain amino acid transport system ATP-binding protein
MVTPMLEVEAITGGYGSVVAVDHVNLRVAPGARHALIGQNGAGKSTLFDLIVGTLRPTSGRILLAGQDISGLPDHARVQAGIAKTSQQTSAFPTLSILDNVALASQRAAGIGLRMFRPAARYGRVQRAAVSHLATVGLFDRRNEKAGSLSHGERRQLDLAMALATGPRVLLLDEPTAGLSAAATARFIDIIAALGPRITTVIVEHDTDLVFHIATHVTVLHQGSVLADGPPDVVRDDAGVQRAYLGDGVRDSLFFDDGAGRTSAPATLGRRPLGGDRHD